MFYSYKEDTRSVKYWKRNADGEFLDCNVPIDAFYKECWAFVRANQHTMKDAINHVKRCGVDALRPLLFALEILAENRDYYLGLGGDVPSRVISSFVDPELIEIVFNPQMFEIMETDTDEYVDACMDLRCRFVFLLQMMMYEFTPILSGAGARVLHDLNIVLKSLWSLYIPTDDSECKNLGLSVVRPKRVEVLNQLNDLFSALARCFAEKEAELAHQAATAKPLKQLRIPMKKYATRAKISRKRAAVLTGLSQMTIRRLDADPRGTMYPGRNVKDEKLLVHWAAGYNAEKFRKAWANKANHPLLISSLDMEQLQKLGFVK